jgi:hypothetical protein
MTPDPVVITGEICGTACFLAALGAFWSLLWKRLRMTKLSAAQQDADRKQPVPPEDTEPEAVVPAAGRELLGMRPVEPLERAS